MTGQAGTGQAGTGQAGTGQAGPLAVVVRGGLVESVHAGHLVVLAPDGTVRTAVGDPDATIWPRSAVKPLQAAAMLGCGLEIDDEGLALGCASHSGTDAHLAVVRRVLAGAGLTEADLQNTPDLPLDPAAAREWGAGGRGPASITQNCSGKHAAMLATCVAVGWDTATYREPDHPLQVRVRATIERVTGVRVDHVTVDGCGAPLFSTTVRGLARAFGRIAAAASVAAAVPGADAGADRGDAVGRAGRAMRAHPWLVGGPGRDVSRFLVAVPGLVAKDGADGVYAAGLADGTGIAVKVADGAARPRAAVLGAVLHGLTGLAAALDVGHTPVMGHGAEVGRVWPLVGVEDAAERAVVGRRWP